MDLLQQEAISCPYCGERIEIQVDCSIPEQSYIEDCQVCCRPISMTIIIGDDEQLSVTVRDENE